MWHEYAPWAPLVLLVCLLSMLTPTADLVLGLFWGSILLSLTAFCARGLGLFLAVTAAGVLGVCQFHQLSQPELSWSPLLAGALLGIYNLGSGRRLTPAIALSQLIIVLGPVPNLAIHLSWEAIPAGLGGVALAGFAAFAASIWKEASQTNR